MGTCYTYLLMDEFDWDYANTSKEKKIEEIKVELPVADVISQWFKFIVIDLDKNSPWGDNAKKLHKWADCVYYYSDHRPWDLQRLETNSN